MLVSLSEAIAQENSDLMRFIAIARDERNTRAGDHAYRKVLRHCQDRIDAAVYRYIRLGLKEEDLRSQALKELMAAIDTFDPTKGKRFKNWLWWKLSNAFKSMFRAHNRDRIGKAKCLATAEITTSTYTFDPIAWDNATRLISSFTDRLQDAIGLRFFHELTWGEIAADIGGTANAVRMMVDRAIKQIREYLVNLPANLDEPPPDCTFSRCRASVGKRLFGWSKAQMASFQRFRVRSRRRCVLTDQLPYRCRTMNRTQRFQLKRLKLVLLGLILPFIPQLQTLAQPGDLGGTGSCQAGPLTPVASAFMRLASSFDQSDLGTQTCNIAVGISVLIAVGFIAVLSVGVINGLRNSEWSMAIIGLFTFVLVVGGISLISNVMLGSTPTPLIFG